MGKPKILYEILPKRVETLLAVGKEVGSNVKIETLKRKLARLDAPPVVEVYGSLLHYSLRDSIEGLSPGMPDKWKYMKDLALIHHIDAQFLTKPFHALLHGDSDVARGIADNPQSSRPLCVFVDAFADGFNPYKDSPKTFWGVYGMVTGLSDGIRNFDMKGEFVIGTYSHHHVLVVFCLITDCFVACIAHSSTLFSFMYFADMFGIFQIPYVSFQNLRRSC